MIEWLNSCFTAGLRSCGQSGANWAFGSQWGPQAYTFGSTLAMILVVMIPVILMVLYYQLVERWVIGWIQVRKGPNRVGW